MVDFFIFSIPMDVLHIFWRNRVLLQIPVGLAVLIDIAGLWQALHGPLVRAITIPINNLPAGLEGFKILQISDLHVGPAIGKKYVETVVRQVNAQKPDLIVVTGDLADAQPAAVARDMQPLADLKSTHGTYYVTGNHEYYWGGPEFVQLTSKLGMVPLLNAHRTVEHQGVPLSVIGMPDPEGARLGHPPDLVKAAAGAKGFRILLAHRPGVFAEAEAMGIDLQFSGHTHAGQYFPFSLLISWAHTYYRGLHQHGRMWLYVNPGTGFWGPPNRFLVASEITSAVLAPGPSPEAT